MKTSRLLVAALPIVLAAAPSCFAGEAVIETTAPLTDQSNEGVKTAVVTAVQSAAKGAAAMGLPHFEVKGFRVLTGFVIVQVWATDGGGAAQENERPGLQGESPRPPLPKQDGSGESDGTMPKKMPGMGDKG